MKVLLLPRKFRKIGFQEWFLVPNNLKVCSFVMGSLKELILRYFKIITSALSFKVEAIFQIFASSLKMYTWDVSLYLRAIKSATVPKNVLVHSLTNSN